MNLYVIRHGKTVWNERGITQGRTNNRLSKEGIAITSEVARQCKDIPFEVIFTSPLMRTVQTANIINKYHKVKVFKVANLIEIDQGIFTGRKFATLTEEEKHLKNSRSKETKMETYEECFLRAKRFVEKLRQSDYKTVLVVTHNCTATFIEDVVTSKTIDFSDAKFVKNFKNAELKKFVID